MLTLETLVSKLRKELRENYQSIGDTMIGGAAKDYEQYKYLLGQAHAYQSMDQALTEMLKPNEEKEETEADDGEDNIIQFGRNTED
jgi:hypothetical protein